MTAQKFRIGTRGSPLALAQAEEVCHKLQQHHGLDDDACEICVIKTTGDQIQDKALREFGGKGLFTKEIEQALIDGDIDMAVHSMKDMPTRLPDGLAIVCQLEREDVRDAFISLSAPNLAALPQRAVLGTSSIRRQAQIKRLRPDLEIITYRGNVQTRLRKLEEGIADATLLACAGLNRLGRQDLVTAPVSVSDMLPAIAQGAIGIEVRAGDTTARDALAPLNHGPTMACVEAERAFLDELDGSCKTPIAGLAILTADKFNFDGMILAPDGSASYEISRSGAIEDAVALCREAAVELRSRAGPEFMALLV